MKAAAARPCRWCGSELEQSGARQCAACKLWQDDNRCLVCRTPIPLKAARCNACSSYQDARRHIPYSTTTLALLIALAGAVTSVLLQCSNVVNRNSDTSFVMAGASQQTIVLTVANTGRSASVLQRFALDFGSLPLQHADLTVVPADRDAGATYVPPGTRTIRLQVTGLALTGGNSKEQIRALLNAGGEVTLTVWVKESDDAPAGPWSKVRATVPASFLGKFILEAIPDDPAHAATAAAR